MLDLSSQTYINSNPRTEFYSQHGGKTVEKANALSNFKDTGNQYRTELTKGALFNNVLQNFICLNEISLIKFGIRNRIQDLNRARFMSTLAKPSIQELTEQVESKQIELVRLAELKGVCDKSVLDQQLLLARSRVFREYATLLVSGKPESQIPGVDGDEVVYNHTNEESFESLVEYLRECVYHPNKYKASSIKKIWISKSGKTERPLGIPTIKDRTLQVLVNLVLLPLVEMTSDPNSYAFRPHRECKMAIAAVKNLLKTIDIEKTKTFMEKNLSKTTEKGHYMIPNQNK